MCLCAFRHVFVIATKISDHYICICEKKTRHHSHRIVYATRHLFKYRATIGFDGSVPGENPINLMSALPSPYVLVSMLASKMTLMLIAQTAIMSSMTVGVAAALLVVNASVIAVTDPLLVAFFFASESKKSVSKAMQTKKQM